jgi:hypothetical protein
VQRQMADRTTDYSSSCKLTLLLDGKCKNCGLDWSAGQYRIEMFISAKGPFYTFALYRAAELSFEQAKARGGEAKGKYWLHGEPPTFPRRCINFVGRLGDIIEPLGYRRAPQDVLEHVVPGKITELDGQPATLRQVLFDELV